MRTAQDIINNARFELVTHIITLMRKLDAFFWFGDKALITGGDEAVTIDFRMCTSVPAIRVEVDNSYLDVEGVCHEVRPLDFIATGDDHNFYVSADGADIDADDISTDELLVIAKVLEDTYANAGKK